MLIPGAGRGTEGNSYKRASYTKKTTREKKVNDKKRNNGGDHVS